MFVLNYSYKTNNGIVLNSNALNGFVTNNQNNNSHTGAPRAYLKYLLFDEDFKLVQGFAERIDNGAGTVHTYNTGGQLVVPKNGFIYVFTTNESPVDVWFDDVSVIHRTGPLLQESSFYPFGMEITPLSSYAAIKVPNERDYQKNELDEEFGLELHYFDARMYDAQVGRFGGVDEKAHEFSKLSPYNYSANNPLYYIDPDGRELFTVIVIAAKIITKAAAKAATKAAAKTAQFVFKAKLSASAKWAGMATYKKVGFFAGGGMNVIQNRHQITSGTVAGGIWRGLFYFGAGAIGSSTAMGSKGLLSIGMGVLQSGGGTVFTDLMGGHLETGEDALRSFSRGGTSALFGKSIGKTFTKGMGGQGDAFDLWKFTKKTGANALEKGVGNVMDKYAEYGSSVASSKGYGGNFYWNALFFGGAAGALGNVGDEMFTRFGYIFPNAKDFIKLLSVPAMSYATDRLKNDLMYNNATKKYRESMNKNKPTKNFWNLVDYGMEMIFFSEGFNLRR